MFNPTRIVTNVFKPTNTSCAPREQRMGASYCPPKTTFNTSTKTCDTKK
jgi:hypothetical protein